MERVLNPHKRFSLASKIDLKEGNRIEISPSSATLMVDICDMLDSVSGAALIIDYGENHAFSSSIRGIKDHKKESMDLWLKHPG